MSEREAGEMEERQDHTPGPWLVHKHRVNTSIRTADGGYVAENVRPMSEQEANARLIAVAPEQHAVLLALDAWDRWWNEGRSVEHAAALREALNAIGVNGALVASLGGIMVAARAAIAKAEGR